MGTQPEHLPEEYHEDERLGAPPRGHHWAQVGNDYVLAAIATGLIANVLLGN